MHAGASFFYEQGVVPYEAQETRAFGLFLGDLLARMDAQDKGSMASTALQGIKAACLKPLPSERPAFRQIASHCHSVLEVCASQASLTSVNCPPTIARPMSYNGECGKTLETVACAPAGAEHRRPGGACLTLQASEEIGGQALQVHLLTAARAKTFKGGDRVRPGHLLCPGVAA